MEAFRIDILPESITITARGDAGVLYAQGLLRQLLVDLRSLYGDNPIGTLPCGVIEDRPALGDRGYMLDVSRNRVPSRATLIELLDFLTILRYNHLELYFEDVFAYPGHRDIWEKTGTITAEDIIFLDAECSARGIELVPNQNSFGHLSSWLEHPEYRHLAEAPHGFSDPWGQTRSYPFSLSPVVPEVEAFLDDLYTHLLPHFSSSRFNAGLDETFDLGQGRSADRIRELAAEDPSEKSVHNATGKVYLQMLERVHRLVTRHGRTLYFWSDIVQNHPDLIAQLPDGVVAVEWGYEADHDFDTRCSRLSRAGIPFLVAPGTAIWNSIGGRLDTAEENTAHAIEAALRHGGRGVLLTDWGDNGHIPPPRLSRPAITMAASYAWNPESSMSGDAAIAWTIRYETGGLDADDAQHLQDCIGIVTNLDALAGAPHIHNASLLGIALFTFEVPAHTSILLSVESTTIDHMQNLVIEAQNALQRANFPAQEPTHPLTTALRFSIDLGFCAIDLLRLHRMHAGRTDHTSESFTEIAARVAVGLKSLDEQLVQHWEKEYRLGGLEKSRAALSKAAEHLQISVSESNA